MSEGKIFGGEGWARKPPLWRALWAVLCDMADSEGRVKTQSVALQDKLAWMASSALIVPSWFSLETALRWLKRKGLIGGTFMGNAVEIAVYPGLTAEASDEDEAMAAVTITGVEERKQGLAPAVGPIAWDEEQERFLGIVPSDIKKWQEAFPKLKVAQQIPKLELWLAMNRYRRVRRWDQWIVRCLQRNALRIECKEALRAGKKTDAGEQW